MRARLGPSKILCAWLALGTAVTRCHRSTAPVATPVPLEACAVGPVSGRSPNDLIVALTDSVAPGLPREARTRSARIIARHLYEPLVRLSCDGRLVPALAESWTTSDGGRSWTFELRHRARFWDGTPVRPAAVIASWTRGQLDDASVPWAGIRWAREVDDSVLAVYLTTPSPEPPAVLAAPALALALPAQSSAWPMGTGPYRPIAEERDALVVQFWDSGLRDRPAIPRSIEFRTAPGARARDLLDRGVDLLVADDPAVLEYARARGGFEVTPLPWDRTYVLFVPATTGSNLPAQVPADGFLEALAREAVGVEARAAEIAGGWRPDSCASPVAFRPDSRPQASRLVYPTEDATARELAHRLVTVAGAPVSGEWVSALFRNPASAPFPVAVGLPSSAWLAALARGGEAAYVFALLANGPAACSPPFRPPGAWFALVDTRAHLAARAGVGGLYVDWDGTPHVRDRR